MVGDFLRDVYYIQDSMWDDIDWIIQIHYLKAGVYELPKMYRILHDLSSPPTLLVFQPNLPELFPNEDLSALSKLKV